MPAPRVVMMYIEPTPYVRGLVDACRDSYDGSIEVLYVTSDLTQRWSLPLDEKGERLLPRSRTRAVKAIWQTLTGEERPTALHLAGWGHGLLAAALVMARALRIPVAVESDSWTGRASGGARNLVKSSLSPLLMSLPTHFLPGGTRQAAYLAGFGVPATRMTVARMTVDVTGMRAYCEHNGARARDMRRAALDIAEAAPVFLFVGRLEPDKGVMDLLEAFDDVTRRHGDSRLVMVGDGTLGDEVNDAARRNPAIVAAGRLAGEELWATYAAADVLVLPSRFEPWGLVVNEAMAFGLAVVISDNVGCRDDLVSDGQEGLIVPAGDVGALAAALSRLAADAGFRRRAGAAARTRIADWTLANEAETVTRTWRRWNGEGSI